MRSGQRQRFAVRGALAAQSRFWVPLTVVLLWSSRVHGQVVDANLWSIEPGGTVTAVARSGNTLYLGGAFTSVGPIMGGGVPVDTKSGVPLRSFAKVAGQVAVVVNDGEGGWFIGGTFTGVGGLKRLNLAHVLADGTVADWAPDPDGGVSALAMKDDALYVGGDFRHISGMPRRSLAAFDIESDKLTSWDPEPGDGGPGSSEYGTVFTILPRGRSIYVGGSFATIGGQIRHNLAALDARSGRATAWNADADSWVRALAIHGNTLYAGGYFFHLGGQLRKYLGAIDIKTGNVLPWDAHVSRMPDYNYDGGPRVLALEQHGNTLFVAGAFSSIGGQPRGGLAALDVETASATSWDPQALGWPGHPELPFFTAVVVHEGAVYVGGQFRALGGREAEPDAMGYAGAVDAQTALARTWNPRPNGGVTALAASECAIYAGGWFNCIRDWVPRAGLAAVDVSTGMVTPWNPGTDGLVWSMVVSGKTVFVAGQFGAVGGQPRSNLAALDATSGMATAWSPNPNGSVYALVKDGTTIYAGGWYSYVGGQARNYLAALDSATGTSSPWNPNPNDIVLTLAIHGGTVYAGGFFSIIGGARRSGMGGVDVASGAASGWTANVDGVVEALAIGRDALYAGGAFTRVNGIPRENLAAVNLTNGDLTAFSVGVDNQVRALTAYNNTVYVGGGFTRIGGEPRGGLAALDGVTGSVLGWDPGCDGGVWSLAHFENVIYAGGAFTRMGIVASVGLAAITPADPPPVAVLGVDQKESLALAQNFPNPARVSTLIRFTLPEAAAVNLEVFDLQGRRMAAPLERELQTQGTHEVQVRTETWPAGCYLYRIEAGRTVIRRKMLVVR